MRKYMIKLPNYPLPFPYITDVAPNEVVEAIFERFGVYPELVV